jgi:hypothetical protein
MMKASRPVVVGRFGIQAFGNFYRSDGLMELQGRKVSYRYLPEDLSRVLVFDLDTKFLCSADRVHRTAWDSEGAIAEMKRLRKKMKSAILQRDAAVTELAQIEQTGYRRRMTDKPEKKGTNKVVQLVPTKFDGISRKLDEQSKKEAVRPENPCRKLFSFDSEAEREKPKRRRIFAHSLLDD